MKNNFLSVMAAMVVGFVALTFATPVQGQTAPQLSYGVANVLKLSQAGIGEEVIVSYIQNSGLPYGGLGASEIIHLNEQGVSGRVITAMLDQEKKVRDVATAQSLLQQSADIQARTPAAPVITPQPQQVYVPPTVTYVEPSPTVIYMRDSSPRLADYGIYPPGRYPYRYHSPKYSYRSYHSYSYGHRGGHFAAGYRGSPFHCW